MQLAPYKSTDIGAARVSVLGKETFPNKDTENGEDSGAEYVAWTELLIRK